MTNKEDFSDEDVADEAFMAGNEENVMDNEILQSLEEEHFGMGDEFE
ncbi:unnamed protein product [Prunus brigantina]